MSQPDRLSNAIAIAAACLLAATSAHAQSTGTTPANVSPPAPHSADVATLDATSTDRADARTPSTAATMANAGSFNSLAPDSAAVDATARDGASPDLASDTAAEKAELPAYLQSDPNAEAAALVPDPWERYNRAIYRFNKRVDHAVLKPVALEYVRVVPKPVRHSVTRFFDNLQQPVTAVNLLLQGHPQRSINSLGRFVVNATIGIGGLFDPASAMHIPPYEEDFGQTLGHWGWRRSRYFLIPFLGPGTLRDRIGSLTDSQISPYKYINPTEARVGLIGLSIVDIRVRILPLDGLSVGVDDDYLLVREAWNARRMHQIDDQAVRITDDPVQTSPAGLHPDATPAAPGSTIPDPSEPPPSDLPAPASIPPDKTQP